MQDPRPRRSHPLIRTTIAVGLAGVLAAGAALAGGVRPAAAHQATPPVALETVRARDTTPPKVHYVRFSRSSVRVSGLAVVPVRLSIRLSDPSGIQDVNQGLDNYLRVVVGPAPGFRSRVYPVLKRTWGTARNGIWSAVVHVPSTWNGTVRVTEVSVSDRAGNRLEGWRPSGKGAQLRVRGTHRPALTFHYSLLKGGGFRIHGRAYFTDTGRPIAGRALAALSEQGCLVDGPLRTTIVTNSRGYYEKRFPRGEVRGVGCVALTGRRAPGQAATLIAYRVGSAPRR